MAVILVLAGSVLGFGSALASLVLLDASLLMALLIWTGVGLLASGLGIAAALGTHRLALSEPCVEPGTHAA